MYQNAISQQFLANQGLEIESPDQFLALDSMLLNHRSSTTVDATQYSSTSHHKAVQHPGWNPANGWKQTLNNLRVVIEPSVILNVLEPWLN